MRTAQAELREPEDYLKSLTEAERMAIAFGELLLDSRRRALTDAEQEALDAGRMIIDQMPPARLAEICRVFKITPWLGTDGRR